MVFVDKWVWPVMENSNSQRRFQIQVERRFEKIVAPFQQFVHDQTTSSALLIITTIVALIIANSPISSLYESLLTTKMGVFVGNGLVSMDLRHWVNEGLMTFFFFILGMEIKRELLAGDISDVRRIVPIVAAALGGMIVPASIFYMFNADTVYAAGWGIPMATDTAFAIGVLAFLGKRIPRSAFTFLTALAIIDDLGAIVVIAAFYSDSVNIAQLEMSLIILVMLVFCNVLGIRKPFVYFLLGALLWLTMLSSGVHATIAGILVALTVPARQKRNTNWFLRRVRELIHRVEQIETRKKVSPPILAHSEQHNLVEEVQTAAEKATTPLRRWENLLEQPVALLVVPVFALVNAGIYVDVNSLQGIWNDDLFLGIVAGLVVGKGIGVPLFTWIAVRKKLGVLPPDLNFVHIVGIGFLGGMGFTMSIFIADLGFGHMQDTLVVAKMAILTASIIAGVVGYFWLRTVVKSDVVGG